jgi:uncharacterized protein DUF6544
MRWAFFVLVVVHGLIHLFGAAKAFALADLPQLTQPISRSLGLLWLAAAAFLLASALAFVLAPRWFWILGALGVVASQIAIASAWHDAKFGTIANAVVLLGVVYGFLSQGPWSLRTEYRQEVTAALARAPVPRLVVEADLLRLPEAVRAYVRASGAVGQPQVVDFRATFRGRIRAGAFEPWMDFGAEQVSVYEEQTPSRLFFMDATMKHLPLDVLHRFVGHAATFRVRLLSAVTMVDAKGPEMNRSETVTLFNGLCLLAPSQLIDPAIAWETVDTQHVRARYTRGKETISAELVFDATTGDLVDFVSDDRFAASSDGKSFTLRRWRTPARSYRAFGPRRLMSVAEARWEAVGGAFTYVELELVSIDFNVLGNARDGDVGRAGG